MGIEWVRLRRKLLQASRRFAAEAMIASEMRGWSGRKILYGLTPPRRLTNVGDQAQAIAIHRWLRRHFPEFAVVELDKDLSSQPLHLLRKSFSDGDLVFLHSGGNLGDRGIWSERARRNLIQLFAHLPVISLPQTVHFSNTPRGREERDRSAFVYNAHPRLTVFGRDPESARVARALFSKATVKVAPDLVLSLGDQRRALRRSGTLLCLRRDKEGIVRESERRRLEQMVPQAESYDTTLDTPIPPEQRAAFLDEALTIFSSHESVVTDRFHGVIFAILTGTPCVALRTVDHKLTSGVDWFEEIEFVRMASDLEAVPELLSQVKAAPSDRIPDFERTCFAPMAQELRRMWV